MTSWIAVLKKLNKTAIFNKINLMKMIKSSKITLGLLLSLFLAGCFDNQVVEICGLYLSSGDKLPIKADKAKGLEDFKNILSQIDKDNFKSVCQDVFAGSPLVCAYYSMGLRVKNNEIILSSASQMLNAKSSDQSFDQYIGDLCPYLQ